MTHQNARRSDLNDRNRKRRIFYRNLANFLALSLFSNLLVLADSLRVLGSAACPPRQSNQEATRRPDVAGDEKDVRPLEPGKPIKRVMSGGQRHVYRLRLSADQFLMAIVEQQGIDVVVQISGPDGKQILSAEKIRQAALKKYSPKASDGDVSRTLRICLGSGEDYRFGRRRGAGQPGGAAEKPQGRSRNSTKIESVRPG